MRNEDGRTRSEQRGARTCGLGGQHARLGTRGEKQVAGSCRRASLLFTEDVDLVDRLPGADGGGNWRKFSQLRPG
jgi:hypothetical protein